MIYLDNAATSWPKPEIVYQTMDKFLRTLGGNAGHGSHSLASAAQQVIDETRLLTARMIGAPEVERVIFTANCTDALNLALKGLLKTGDQVITSHLEHNAVMRPLARLQKIGISVTQIPVSPQTGYTDPQALEKAITARTRLIVMVHVSNVNGVIQPVGEYGAIARKHGVTFLVDAAQSVGHLRLDVVRNQIDLLAFSAHKGPLGPPGVGVLYIGPGVNPDTLREGGTGTFSESGSQPEKYPQKYESGTLNSVGIAGLGAGLQFINQEGPGRIREHDRKLTGRMIEGLATIRGVKLYIAPDMDWQAPVVSFNLAGFEPGEVGAILDQAFDIKVRTGLHCAPAAHRTLGSFPGGTVRLSPGYFNTADEIDRALRAISQIAHSRPSRN